MRRKIFLLMLSFLLLTPFRHAQAVIYLNRGTPGESVRLSDTEEYNGIDKAEEISIEFAQQAEEKLKLTDLEGLETKMAQSANPLAPKLIKDKVVHADPESYVASGVIAPCVISGKDPNNLQYGYYVTEAIPGSDILDENSRKIGSYYVPGYSVKPQADGSYNYRVDQALLPETAIPPCGSTATGMDQESAEVAFKQQSGISIVFRFLQEVINNIFKQQESAEVEIVHQQAWSWSDRWTRLLAGKSADLSYMPDSEQEKLSDSDGFFNTQRPNLLSISAPKAHASQENFTFNDVSAKTNDGNVSEVIRGDEFHDCSLAPKLAQDKFGVDSAKCKFEPASGGSCANGDLPNLINIKDDCSLSNTDSLKSNFSANFPNGIPELFLDAINSAAGTYNVPASLMVGTLYFEGLFNKPFIYTEENVNKWLQCQELMPECTYTVLGDNPEDAYYGTAQLPFGHIPKWFYLGGESNGSWAAVQKVDSSRTKDIVSPCNMLDGIFGAASKLYFGAAEVPPAAQGLGNCGGYPLSNTSRPTSCSQWTDAMAVQAMTAYAGYCTEPGQNDGYKAVPGRIDTALELFHKYR